MTIAQMASPSIAITDGINSALTSKHIDLNLNSFSFPNNFM